MPIYEYQCLACGHQEEFIQKMSDKPLTKCPACGKNKLQKQVSSTAFQLKGEGWYVTDFKNKKPPQQTDTPTKATTDTSGDKQSDAPKSDMGDNKQSDKPKPDTAKTETTKKE